MDQGEKSARRARSETFFDVNWTDDLLMERGRSAVLFADRKTASLIAEALQEKPGRCLPWRVGFAC